MENALQTQERKNFKTTALEVNQTVPAVQPLQGSDLALTNDQQGRKQLAEIIAQCFDGLKLYGKEPEQLANAVKLFDLALGSFTIAQIRSAFVSHLQRSNEMPTPSDIVGYIRRGGRPPFDKAMYTALVQKRERTAFVDAGYHGNCLTSEEENYIREYEEDLLRG